MAVPPVSNHYERIATDPTSKPPHRQPYRMSDSERLEFETQIARLLANCWVTDSHSRFVATVIVVTKPDGSGLQMCADYRGLDAITTRDRYPLGCIEDLIDRLHHSSAFTRLDLSSGYHRLHNHPDDTCNTACVTPDGNCEWTVIPFGLANAPSACMRAIHCMLGPYKKLAIVNLDEVPIFSRDLADNIMHVDSILLASRAVHFLLNERRCAFGASVTSFVGLKVNSSRIHREERKIVAPNDWLVPVSTVQLQSFLGLAGYYGKFLHKFPHRITQLYMLRTERARFGCFGSTRRSSTKLAGPWYLLRFWHDAFQMASTSCALMLPTWQLEAFWLECNPWDRRACWSDDCWASSLENSITSWHATLHMTSSVWWSMST